MRTTARLLTGTALTVAAVGALGAPAFAGESETLEVYPSSATPGTTVTVNTLACGKHGHGVGDAQSLGAGDFQLNPSTHKEVVVGQFKVPHHTKAGTYWISVACDNGRTARGELRVEHKVPTGHVSTGVGGSVGPDTTQIAAGAAVLAAAAVGGTWLLRRRASGAQDG
ncbi:hypothetical protein [Streptomyces sp. NPDC013457]|uniref:hypothetical protein n=1 Tax=Streptomyces sp. NPDC013457 TaxID=3364866 RepID=UPI0036FD6DAE